MHLKLLKYARFVRFSTGKVEILLTIYYRQNKSVVNEKVNELKNRVYHMSKVITDTFTPNDETGSEEVIVKAAKGIEQDIKDLLR